MANAAAALRLKYLHEAAFTMSLRAPTTSAALGAQYNSTLFHSGFQLSRFRKHELCGACGIVLVPGSTCGITITRRRARTIDRKIRGRESDAANTLKQRNSVTKTVVFTCQQCKRQTRHALRPAVKGSSIAVSSSLPSTSTAAVDTTFNMLATSSIPTTAREVVSKKRPKGRKQSGLQAMLARSKVGTPAPVRALNLTDFIKTG